MNNKNRVLVAVGDSHTAGAEIEFEHQGSCYEKAWPKHLGDIRKYSKTYNLAASGACNEYIFRTAQSWVITNILINKKYKPEDVDLFLMWSSNDRTEMYFDYPFNKVYQITTDMDKSFLGEKLNEKYGDYIDMWQIQYTMLHNHLMSSFKNLQMVVNISEWMEFKNIKTYQISGISEMENLQQLRENYKQHPLYIPYYNLLKLYGENRINKHIGFSKQEETYFHNYKKNIDKHLSKFSVNFHFDEETHIDWANKVNDFFFKPNLI